jgi:hypothetical protein
MEDADGKNRACVNYSCIFDRHLTKLLNPFFSCNCGWSEQIARIDEGVKRWQKEKGELEAKIAGIE